MLIKHMFGTSEITVRKPCVSENPVGHSFANDGKNTSVIVLSPPLSGMLPLLIKHRNNIIAIYQDINLKLIHLRLRD